MVVLCSGLTPTCHCQPPQSRRTNLNHASLYFSTCCSNETFFACLSNKTFFACRSDKTFFAFRSNKTFFTCLSKKTFSVLRNMQIQDYSHVNPGLTIHSTGSHTPAHTLKMLSFQRHCHEICRCSNRLWKIFFILEHIFLCCCHSKPIYGVCRIKSQHQMYGI